MGGTAVCVGTRVPVQTLRDYLGAGDPLDEFRHVPSVAASHPSAVPLEGGLSSRAQEGQGPPTG
jgi:hypothetical protein